MRGPVRSRRGLCLITAAGAMLLLLQLSTLAQSGGQAVESTPDIELMRAYGAAVRRSYRTGRKPDVDTPHFAALEAEVQRRRLVTVATYDDVERGIVFIGMSVPRMHAALDNLERVEVVNFERFTLTVYRGDVKDWGNWRPIRPQRELALVCDGKLVGYRIVGVTTFETWSGVPVSKSKVQTNFAPGHFLPTSAESQKYIRTGQSAPGKPERKDNWAGGSGWLMHQLDSTGTKQAMERVGTSFQKVMVEVTFAQKIEEFASSSRYQTLKQHVEAACK